MNQHIKSLLAAILLLFLAPSVDAWWWTADKPPSDPTIELKSDKDRLLKDVHAKDMEIVALRSDVTVLSSEVTRLKRLEGWLYAATISFAVVCLFTYCLGLANGLAIKRKVFANDTGTAET